MSDTLRMPPIRNPLPTRSLRGRRRLTQGFAPRLDSLLSMSLRPKIDRCWSIGRESRRRGAEVVAREGPASRRYLCWSIWGFPTPYPRGFSVAASRWSRCCGQLDFWVKNAVDRRCLRCTWSRAEPPKAGQSGRCAARLASA